MLLLTDWFQTNYGVVDWSVPRQVGVRLFNRIPYETTPERGSPLQQKFSVLNTEADLDDHPEWVTAEATAVATVTGTPANLYLASEVIGDADVLQLQSVGGFGAASLEDTPQSGFFLDNGVDPINEIIAGAAFFLIGTYGSVVNPLLFATTAGLGEFTVAHDGAVYGQSDTLGTPFVIGTINPGEFFTGTLLLDLAPPSWEGSRSEHIWFEPQRTNFIANPSFEPTAAVPGSGSTGYWRSGVADGTSSVGVDPIGSSEYCGKFTRLSGETPLVVESNLFPKVGPWLSVSFAVSGAGSLRFGVVATDSAHVNYTYIQSGLLPTSLTWQRVNGLIRIPDDVSNLLFRVEFTGDDLWIDKVLADPHESQFSYFDGSTDDGLPGDFMWHGGATRRSEQFSLYYTNYLNTKSRIVGTFDPTDNVYKGGLLEEWAPESSSITAHWEAVSPITPLNWSGDAFYPISNVSGTPVSVPTAVLNFDLLPQEAEEGYSRILTEDGDYLVTNFGQRITTEWDSDTVPAPT
jgi:hypothetical protein